VDHDFGVLFGLIAKKVARGTKNFLRESAMSREQAMEALEIGMALADQLAAQGIGLLGTGDMGIGNTTSSAAITAVLTGETVAQVTGRGTGIDDDGYRRKVEVIEQAIMRHQPNPTDPLDVLSKVGGLEIAGLAGLILEELRIGFPWCWTDSLPGRQRSLRPRCSHSAATISLPRTNRWSADTT